MSPETRRTEKVIPTSPPEWRHAGLAWSHDHGMVAVAHGRLGIFQMEPLTADEARVWCRDLDTLVGYLRAIGEVE